ncbi:unnamed protein product [Laminaria digitata]
MGCDLHCSHTLGALITKLGRGDEFLGESIHLRWRTSGEPWTLQSANLNAFDGRERGTYTDGFTGDVDDMDLDIDLKDSQDDPAGGGTVSLIERKTTRGLCSACHEVGQRNILPIRRYLSFVCAV